MPDTVPLLCLSQAVLLNEVNEILLIMAKNIVLKLESASFFFFFLRIRVCRFAGVSL